MGFKATVIGVLLCSIRASAECAGQCSAGTESKGLRPLDVTGTCHGWDCSTDSQFCPEWIDGSAPGGYCCVDGIWGGAGHATGACVDTCGSSSVSRPGDITDSCHGWDCYTENQYCPDGIPGSAPGGYCCVDGQWGGNDHATGQCNLGCENCPDGQHSYSGGYCQDCAPGQSSNSGHTSCIDCPAGYYNPSWGGTCSICRAGQYSAEGFTGCFDCAIGKYSSSEGSSSCATCAAGKYCGYGCSSCESCAAGSVSEAGQGSCQTCGAGTFAATADQPFPCTLCGDDPTIYNKNFWDPSQSGLTSNDACKCARGRTGANCEQEDCAATAAAVSLGFLLLEVQWPQHARTCVEIKFTARSS